MASTFSNLGLNLQGTGDNAGTWGAITNVNLQEIDNAIAGVITITVTGNTTLAFTTNSTSTTYTDEAGRNKTIILSGALSATTVTITVPNIEKDYVIINNSGGTATISSGGSTTVSIGTGSKNYIIVDPSTTSVITATPAVQVGGTTNAVQYNNAGALAGSTNLTFNGTTFAMQTATALNLTATTLVGRINPRVVSTASSTSVTPDISAADIYAFTALSTTLVIATPTGTPLDGNKLIFRVLDNGTTRTLTWSSTYTAIGVTLPTATTANKTVYVGCIYNTNNTRWDAIAVTTQA
jgi:hypothetical protein